MPESAPHPNRPSEMTKAIGLQADDFRRHGDSDAGSVDGRSSEGDTTFDESDRSGGKSLRSSVESNAMDHVTAMLRFYHEQENLPRRWSDAASDDGVMDVYAKLLAHGGDDDDDDDDDGDDGDDGPAPRLSIKQRRRRRSCSRSVDTCSRSLEEIIRETDEEDDADEDSDEHAMLVSSVPMGGSNNDNPIYNFRNRSMSAGAPSIMSSGSGSGGSGATPKIDNRVFDKLLLMQANDQDEDEDEIEVNRRSSVRYQNIRGSLTNIKDILGEKTHNLKDNLAERATLLGDIIMNSNSDSNLSKAASYASKENPPAEADHGRFSMLKRRKASVDSNTYNITEPGRFLLPTNFESGKSSRNRRGTVESESMWSAAASFFDRRRGNEDEQSQNSESSSEDEDSIRKPNGSRSDRRLVRQWDKLPTNDVDEENGEGEDHKAKRNDSWISLGMIEDLQGDIINRRRRATLTPYIDDGGKSYHGLKTDDGIYYRPGQRTINRCIAVLFAVAVTAISSALVGFSVNRSNERLHQIFVPIKPGDNETLTEAVDVIAGHGHYSKDDLFNMAKSVDDHCHPDQLSTANGRW